MKNNNLDLTLKERQNKKLSKKKKVQLRSVKPMIRKLKKKKELKRRKTDKKKL